MPKTSPSRAGRLLTVAVSASLALAFASGAAHAQPVGDGYSFAGPVTGVALDGPTVVARRAVPVGVYAVTITATAVNNESAGGGQVVCSLEGFSGDLLVAEQPVWIALPAAEPGGAARVSFSGTTAMTIGESGRVRVVCTNSSTIDDAQIEVESVILVAVRLASDRRRS